MSLRRPVWALYVLIVGLAVHNLVMSQLWRAGVRGGALSAIAGWKDVLLLVALGLVVWRRRGLPFDRSYVVDWLALAFGAFVVVYAVLPQSLARRRRDAQGRALRGAPRPAARRGVLPRPRPRPDVGGAPARLPRASWPRPRASRPSGCSTSFSCRSRGGATRRGGSGISSGLTYSGLSGLPENFVYNEGGGVVFRRLTSTFLSPLATAYLLVVALLFVPLRGRRWGWPLALLLFAALLWTHTRAALLALLLALLVLAVLRRRLFFVGLAVAVAAISFVFVQAYDHIGPRTHFTTSELAYQERHAHETPVKSNDATSANEASTSEHLSSFRAGARTALHHPWGFGLGNAGRDGGSDARDDRSGRVDLHRAGGRDRARRRA